MAYIHHAEVVQSLETISNLRNKVLLEIKAAQLT